MRILVRASTIRAPVLTPPSSRVYAYSREAEGDIASAADVDGGLSALSREGEATRGTVLYFLSDVEGETSRAAARISVLDREGEAGFAAPGGGGPSQYAFYRTEIVASQSDLAAGAFVDHVVRGSWQGDWLKQSNLTGGRIRHASCYDLIFETLDAVPVRLDHEIESYNGTTGTLQYALRLPSWDPQTAQFRARIRYGAAL